MLKKSELKNNGKLKVPKGLVIKGQGVQDIYGPKVDILKSDIQDVLDSGEVIPETLPSQVTAVQKAEAQFKGVTEDVHSVADGQVISIEDVKDPVFSQRMMGDGFAVEPENGKIVSPLAGKVSSIFPTKHALGLVSVKVEHTGKLVANAPVAKVEL